MWMAIKNSCRFHRVWWRMCLRHYLWRIRCEGKRWAWPAKALLWRLACKIIWAGSPYLRETYTKYRNGAWSSKMGALSFELWLRHVTDHKPNR